VRLGTNVPTGIVATSNRPSTPRAFASFGHRRVRVVRALARWRYARSAKSISAMNAERSSSFDRLNLNELPVQWVALLAQYRRNIVSFGAHDFETVRFFHADFLGFRRKHPSVL
jgi:hypothetical protein